jgi:hypothetical protein
MGFKGLNWGGGGMKREWLIYFKVSWNLPEETEETTEIHL